MLKCTNPIWTSFALVVGMGALHAQTTNIYPQSGTVGIGTTSPNSQAALDVESGGIISTGATYLNGSLVNTGRTSLILNNSSGETYSLTSGIPNVSESGFSINRLKEYTYGSWIYATALPVFTISGSNVGIGAVSPQYPLDITYTDSGTNSASNVFRLSHLTGGTSSGGFGTGMEFDGQSYAPGPNSQVGYAWISMIEDSFNVGRLDFSTLFGYGSIVRGMSIINGNVGIGTTSPQAKLEVAGSVKVSGSGSSIIFSDGSTQSTAWTGSLCGGDYAESVDVSEDRTKYLPGDVLVIDPNFEGKVLKSSESYSTSVIGIFSTKPGVIGRRQTTAKTANEVPMAMIGIVPTKVSAENGSIKLGDLLVTSSIPGYAMLGTDRSRMLGAVIGKAFGHLDSGTGVIEVAVTLQ